MHKMSSMSFNDIMKIEIVSNIINDDKKQNISNVYYFNEYLKFLNECEYYLVDKNHPNIIDMINKHKQKNNDIDNIVYINDKILLSVSTSYFSETEHLYTQDLLTHNGFEDMYEEFYSWMD